MAYRMEIAMNNLKIICAIGIMSISACFQGCCSDCYRQKEMYRELGDMAYAALDNPQRDELLNELIEKAINGKNYDFDKYIYVRTLIHDQGYYGFEDRDVELLRGLGDKRFLCALKRQDGELQGRVCSNLIR